jgi:hypothetical protein
MGFQIVFNDIVDDTEMMVSKTNDNNVMIRMDSYNKGESTVIVLDISTAIKFAKTLRTEINKAKEVGDE